MRLLPIEGAEKARVACFADELDVAIEAMMLVFAGRCRMKVAIHNGIATILVF